MLRLPIIIFVFILLSGCVKENTSTTVVNNPVDTSMAVSLYSGTFNNGPYGVVTGKARIYSLNDRKILALENFNSSNGPDLHVYISREEQPVNYIDLGRLQSVTGNQQYLLSSGVDISEYKYALIHCQRYNHLFGTAQLK